MSTLVQQRRETDSQSKREWECVQLKENLAEIIFVCAHAHTKLLSFYAEKQKMKSPPPQR